ncbi:hypothetical protein TNCV_323811 [Trichonephila clavipes]|nr:hypothetical protein TNCV_323811 [Trichonephila clavipes]
MPIYSIKEISGDFTDSLSNSGDFKVSSKIDISHIPVGIENLSNNYVLRAFNSNLCDVLSESESFIKVDTKIFGVVRPGDSLLLEGNFGGLFARKILPLFLRCLVRSSKRRTRSQGEPGVH